MPAMKSALPPCAVLHDNAKGQPNCEKASDTLKLRDILPKLDQFSEVSTPLIEAEYWPPRDVHI